MKSKKLIIAAISALVLVGCASPREKEQEVAAQKTADELMSSSAAVEKQDDKSRQFIRTARLKFKTSNVAEATYSIEETTSRHGGFVTSTTLESRIDNVSTVAVSADSSRETTHYTVVNEIALRVPNYKLDIVLKEFAKNVDYLDCRVITAEDVALNILDNKMTRERNEKYNASVQNDIRQPGGKLKEEVLAENAVLNSQEMADKATIANLSLADQVAFSTINLSIYQSQGVKHAMICNEHTPVPYEPPFGTKLAESLSAGWQMVTAVVLFFARLWALMLVTAIAFVAWKYYGRKMQESAKS